MKRLVICIFIILTRFTTLANDSSLYITVVENNYVYYSNNLPISVKEINNLEIRNLDFYGSLNYVPKEILELKSIRSIKCTLVQGNICMNLLCSFPLLEYFTFLSKDEIDLKEKDFSLFCPSLKHLYIDPYGGLKNVPDTLKYNNIELLYILGIMDNHSFLPSTKATQISLSGKYEYLEKVMCSKKLLNAKEVALYPLPPFDTICTTFFEPGILKELSLNVKDEPKNFETLTNMKGVEEIFLSKCPCFESLLLLNKNETLLRVKCEEKKNWKRRRLNHNSKRLKFKLTVYD